MSAGSISPRPSSLRAPTPTLLLLAFLASGCSTTSEPLEPLTLSEGPSLALEVGEEFQLSVRGGTGATSWESSAPAVVSVVPVTGFLQAMGAGSATITATRGSQSSSVEVTVTVPPLLDITPADVELSAQQGGGLTEPARLNVRNTGGGALGSISVAGVVYGAGEPDGWLRTSVDGQGVVVRGDPGGLPAGVYTAVLQVAAVQARNSPQSAAVVLVVSGVPVMALEPSALGLVAVEGENPGVREVAVTNVGQGTLARLAVSVEYGPGTSGWLGSPQVEAGTNGGVLRFTPATSGLARATYSAEVTVTSAVPLVEPVVLPVTLTVTTGPAIALDPAALSIEVVSGSGTSAPHAVMVTNGGGGTLTGLGASVTYQIGNAGWLAVSLSGTTAPAALQLQVDPGDRPPGIYTATVRVTSPVAENDPVLLPLTLTITPPPILAVSPGTLNLEAVLGSGTTLDRTVNITNGGGGTIGGLTASSPVYTSGSPGWLEILQPPGSTTPTQLRLRINTGGLGTGSYQARVTVASTTPGVNPATVTVNLTVLHTFTTHIRPLMSGCGGCHTSAPDYRSTLSNAALYQQVMGRVVPGNPNASPFYLRIAPNTGVSHSGGKLSTANGEVVREWILRGARF